MINRIAAVRNGILNFICMNTVLTRMANFSNSDLHYARLKQLFYDILHGLIPRNNAILWGL